MKLLSEIQEWQIGAIEQFGDPATPVGQIFAKFVREPSPLRDIALAAWHDNKLHIDFGGGWLPVPVDDSGPSVTSDTGEIRAFGITKIVPGVWSVFPSLNMPGIIHAFVHIYDAPDPAPWESTIIVVSSIGGRGRIHGS